MQVIEATVQGDKVKIFCPEPGDQFGYELSMFVRKNRFMGLDVESLPFGLDGADMWGPLRGQWNRLVQLGGLTEGWVLRAKDHADEIVSVVSDLQNQFTTWTDVDVRAIYADFGIDISARYYDGITLALLRSPGQFVSHRLKDAAREYGIPELEDGAADLAARVEELRVRRPSMAIKQRKTESEAQWAKRRAARVKEVEAYDKRYPVIGWNEWRDIPINEPLYLKYAGLDAIGARRLFPLQVQSCRDYGIPSDTIKREFVRQQRVVRRTIRRGMVTDQAYTRHQLGTIGAEHKKAKAEFEALTGYKAGSPYRHRWFTEQGIVFDKFTDNGAPSLAKQNLRDLIVKYARDTWAPSLTEAGHQGLALLRKVSETKNLHDFCTGLLKFMDPNSVVRPSVRILGAETGRHTVTSPAVQTLSNGNPVRGCFPVIAGYVQASIDLSQIEVRIIAALSGETALIEAFNRGEDAYNQIAESLFGGNFTKRERSIAKRIILATMYGGGVDTIVVQLHDVDGIVVEPEQVAAIRKDFRSKYRKITQYAYKMNTGEDVWLYSGRYVPGDLEKPYRGVNSACQGTGRDLLMDCEDRACEAGFEENIILDIHDEILFMLPIAGLRQSLLTLRQAFQVPFKGVKVTCDIEIYLERWGHDQLVPRPEGLCRAVKEGTMTTYELVKEWN